MIIVITPQSAIIPLAFAILFRSTPITTTTPMINAAAALPVAAATAITESLSLALSEIRGHFIINPDRVPKFYILFKYVRLNCDILHRV